MMKAIETSGTIDEEHRLHLDGPVPVAGPSRVRVIILVPDDDDIDEQNWLRSVANPALEDWNDPAEDIYTFEDGRPFGDKR